MVERIKLNHDSRLSLKEGDVVAVTDDSGNSKDWTVKYGIWQLGHGAWVCGLHGIAGCYDLNRVTHLIRETVAAEEK